MIVNGKLIREKLEKKIVTALQGKKKEVCFVMFGENQSSLQYVGIKCAFAERLGITAKVLKYREDTSESEAVKIVEEVSKQGFDGIVIQLPLPTQFDVQKILNLVPPELDIDVLSEKTKELYLNGKSRMLPPVSRAVFEILDFYRVSLVEKEVLVIGNGKLVGEPVSIALKSKNIDFRQIDKKTPEDVQKKLISSADIIISGAGSPYFIKPEMIKDGVVLIDAGTSEQNGKIVGDADPLCSEKASVFTPVPNGVGPVTLACLFLNL